MGTGFIRSTLLAVAVIVPCSLWAEEPKEVAPAAGNQSDTKPKDAKPAVYDEQADPQQQIDTAVRTARHRNQRVLLSLGGNWCGWCIKLHKLFDENQEIAKLLDEEFVVGWIDSANLDKVAAFGADARKEIGKHGVPFLVVLDADGKVLALQDTGSLEEGPVHDPAKVKAFLKTWVAPLMDAETLLADAESRKGNEQACAGANRLQWLWLVPSARRFCARACRAIRPRLRVLEDQRQPHVSWRGGRETTGLWRAKRGAVERDSRRRRQGFGDIGRSAGKRRLPRCAA